MTDLFTSKKLTFQDFLFSLDLYKYQMNLYYKNNFRQSSYLGLFLSIFIYIAIAIMAVYFLSSNQYSLVQVNESSYKNTFSPFGYPIGMGAYDEDTHEFLDSEDFQVKTVIDLGSSPVIMGFGSCERMEDYLKEQFGKKYTDVEKPPGWKYYTCPFGAGFNISSNPINSQVSSTTFYMYLIPRQINDFHRNITFKMIFIMEYLDEKPTENNIKMKIQEFNLKLRRENTFEMDIYFTQNVFKVTGNLLRGSIDPQTYYHMDEINLKDDIYNPYPYVDSSEYNSSPFLEEIGKVRYGLFQKRPEFEKIYPSIMDIVGTIGGWMNVIVMVTNCIFNFLIPNFIKFDLIKYLMNQDMFDISKVQRLNTHSCRYSTIIDKNTLAKLKENKKPVPINTVNPNLSGMSAPAKENNFLLSNQDRINFKGYSTPQKRNETGTQGMTGMITTNFNAGGTQKTQSPRRKFSLMKKGFSLKDVNIKCIYYFIPFAFFINNKKNEKLKYLDMLVESFLSMENIYRMNKEVEYALKFNIGDE